MFSIQIGYILKEETSTELNRAYFLNVNFYERYPFFFWQFSRGDCEEEQK